MSIPDGTKFHGVAPSVDTSNRGSASLNSKRDAYTIDEICDSCSEGIIKIEPVLFVTASPGGTGTLTEMVNIVDFDWVGNSGTYTYTLPSATAIPYRKIRFVNNSTIGANTKIDLAAPVGENIDGGATYEINKAFNGCAVWSDGTQWIVIQAKST
jgi:hypothetical protein